MKKAKKAPQYKYGIEITKPHSKEMYAHNEAISDEMKSNIAAAWKFSYAIAEEQFINDLDDDQVGMDFMDHEYDSNDHQELDTLSRAVTVTGYGSGFTIRDVQSDFERDLENAENWRMHEIYEELCDIGLGFVPVLKQGMVGFGTPDYKYWHQDASYINRHEHSTVTNLFRKHANESISK